MNKQPPVQIKKAIVDFFIVLTSFSFVIFYLYLRIFRKQLHINLLIPEEIQKYYWVFLYFFLTSCLILGLLLLNIYLKKRMMKKEKKDIGFLDKFLLHLNQKINSWNIFYTGYTIIFHWIKPIYMQYVVMYTNNILEYSNFKNKFIMISAVVLPRVIIICILLFEIYMKSLHFYFFSLLLLFIPLIFRFLLFVYSDINKQVLPKLNELVEKVPNTEKITLTLNGKTETFGTLGYRIKPEFAIRSDGKVVDVDHFMMHLYNPMLFIGPHMEVYILPLYNKYTKITILLYISIQTICWAYILFLV